MKKLVLILLLSIFTVFSTKAQGCSDAGFCTLNSIKPGYQQSDFSEQLKLGFSLGAADNDIAVVGSYLEYNKQLTDKLAFDTKLTWLSQSGNGISTRGISDLYMNVSHRASERLKILAGIKIPFSDANKKLNGISLPMDYQSSLGTFDGIFGIGLNISKLQLTVAMQQPIKQNRNAFTKEQYAATSPLSTFQSTNGFNRSGDVLLRASFPIVAKEKIKITPSILPIYHLKNDSFVSNGQRSSIIGSKGLTLNGNLYLDYALNEKNGIQLNFGSPFIIRDVRPDGLTRSFVANLEYQFKF